MKKRRWENSFSCFNNSISNITCDIHQPLFPTEKRRRFIRTLGKASYNRLVLRQKIGEVKLVD